MVSKTQPYEKLVDYVKSNPQKGLTIPHTDIETIIGIPRPLSQRRHSPCGSVD